jgi:hypothetical protein
VTRAALIMFVYAGVVIGLSLLAFVLAPPGANAATAVAMGGGSALVMVVMAVLSLLGRRNRKLGMVGIHVGLLLPLIFAATFLLRIGPSYRSSGVHRYFETAYERAVNTGAVASTSDAKDAFLKAGRDSVSGQEIPPTDKAYLGLILTLLFGASLAAFVLLLLSRPTLPKPAREGDDGSGKDGSGSSAFD